VAIIETIDINGVGDVKLGVFALEHCCNPKHIAAPADAEISVAELALGEIADAHKLNCSYQLLSSPLLRYCSDDRICPTEERPWPSLKGEDDDYIIMLSG
jgi:hypothetical protein